LLIETTWHGSSGGFLTVHPNTTRASYSFIRLPFNERVKFVDANVDTICAIADNPLKVRLA